MVQLFQINFVICHEPGGIGRVGYFWECKYALTCSPVLTSIVLNNLDIAVDSESIASIGRCIVI